jgi:anti-sigma factor RsiW
MAECREMSLMLGAFEDAELEPKEMQEVAFHLARCDSCAGLLADYSTVGRGLRLLTSAPVVSGFSSAVLARIERLPRPWFRRVERFFGRAADFAGSGFAWDGAIAAVAVLSTILLTPYAAQFANRRLPSTTSASNQVAQTTVGEPAMADNDSHAVISRLESEIPSVAVWSEPRKDTTVIWLPDQPEGRHGAAPR